LHLFNILYVDRNYLYECGEKGHKKAFMNEILVIC
jgi:hypothetical protein